VAPLFETLGDGLTVAVKTEQGASRDRTILRRSAAMEAAVVEIVEAGLQLPDWQGLLYVMGWGSDESFRPLYVGKAERKGVRHPISANIVGLRTNKTKFARWGDGLDYHIGDLSHAIYGFRAYRRPQRKYLRWAERLFRSYPPAVLREPVSFVAVPWHDGDAGPSGLVGSLPAVEKEVIALASAGYGDVLLNKDGI
jgi:hypothetical protein